MTLNPALQFPTRTLVILGIAAFAAMALWLFLPGGSQTSWMGSGNAALPPSLHVDGTVGVTSADNVVTKLIVPLAVRGDDGITLTEGGRLHATTLMSDTAAAAVPATYTVAWLDGNGDEILDPGEHAVLTVGLPERSSVHPGNPVGLIIRPIDSMPLTIEDVLN